MGRLKLTKIFISMLLLFLSVDGFSEPDKSQLTDSYFVHKVGQTTCAHVKESEDNVVFKSVLEMWLAGYFTAVNTIQSSVATHVDSDKLKQAISYIIAECGHSENSSLWVVQLVDDFWRNTPNPPIYSSPLDKPTTYNQHLHRTP